MEDELVRHDLVCIECGMPMEDAFYEEDENWRGFEGFCLPCQGKHVAVEKEEEDD